MENSSVRSTPLCRRTGLTFPTPGISEYLDITGLLVPIEFMDTDSNLTSEPVEYIILSVKLLSRVPPKIEANTPRLVIKIIKRASLA